MTYQELKAKVSAALGDVGFSIEATDDGQLVIYTDLKEVEDQDELENYVFREEMIPVRVACTSYQLGLILVFTAEHYSQMAVMAYKVSDDVIIHEANGIKA